MAIVYIYGTRLFGSCDYFTVEGQEMYVRTLFDHCNSMPYGPKESYLFLPDGCAIELPEVVGRSVGWAWLRYLAWDSFLILMVVAVIQLVRGHSDEVWPWALLGLSVVCLFAAILLTVYKPKASEKSKQQYLNMVGLVVVQRFLQELAAAEAADPGGPDQEAVQLVEMQDHGH
ncbi:PREDICTED: uncharacterized protein LOC109461934 [Branchiostoma belcheri]|uniref:Uncharacterized protein LOC109461934 n=1 Tax=Branchiostoma belcheri TaxID=7741 RepID=A0A6P4XTI1_BRABE|nr:PREDICTED: uncharacterized protein LOC109461934 [Branchiostoma belcheri]